MKNYYEILGVDKTATLKDIKTAYRNLAKRHHPDKNKGDKESEEKFKEIQEAYSVLSDPRSRNDYDNPQPSNPTNPWERMKEEMNRMRYMRRRMIPIQITIEQMLNGHQIEIEVNGESKTIEIPKGIEDGSQISFLVAENYQVVFVVYVINDSEFQIAGLDTLRSESVTVRVAMCGGSVLVKNIYGNEIKLTIPKGIQPGTRLKLSKQGIKRHDEQRGDLYVDINVKIPTDLTDDQIKAINDLFDQNHIN